MPKPKSVKTIPFTEVWCEYQPEGGFMEAMFLNWMFIRQNGRLKSGHYYLIPKTKVKAMMKKAGYLAGISHPKTKKTDLCDCDSTALEPKGDCKIHGLPRPASKKGKKK